MVSNYYEDDVLPTRYNPRRVTGIEFTGESETRQEFKNECDINRIMKKYLTTGILPGAVGEQKYGDFSDVGDYLQAVTFVQETRAKFNEMTPEVREKFKTPEALVSFMMDERNRDAAEALGLVEKRQKEAEAKKVADESGKV
jgi:hypothetical protein